jgi:prepilin-type N-terminal cleavage/methylation domain-containing protein
MVKSDPEALLNGLVRKKAFTLVELLVVISIIALLPAIMMPALQKARELARRVTCTANLHQQGIALSAYGATYNRFPPPVHQGFWPFGGMGYPPKGSHLASPFLDFQPAGQAALLKGKFLSDIHFLYCPAASKYHFTYDSVFLAWQTNRTWNPKWPDELNYYVFYIGYPYWVSWTPIGPAGTPSDYSPEKDVVQLKITSQGPTSRGDTVAISDMTITEQGTGDAAAAESLGYWVNHVKNAGAGFNFSSRGKVSGGNTLYNDGSVKWVPFSEMKKNSRIHVTRDIDSRYWWYYWF